jgi:hypothetical protein
MKTCSKCKKPKALDEFGADKRATDGKRSSCKTCDSKRSGDWNRANKASCSAYRSRYFVGQRARVLISCAKKRARLRGLAFDLDQHRTEIQRRIDAGCCEISGVPFNLHGGRTFDSPSIDRSNPREGYIYSNIRIVCDAMNAALGDWGEEVLRAVVTSWLRKCEREGVAGAYVPAAQESNVNAAIRTV